MAGLALTLALLLALGFSARRALRRRALRLALPGGSAETSIDVDDFDAIDEGVRARPCTCGGILEAHGERSETSGDRRFRVVQAECRRCEQRVSLWFDVTRMYH